MWNSAADAVVLVSLLANIYGVPPDYARCIVENESAFNHIAIGDNNRALGLWQWHEPSWRHVRGKMGLDPDPQLRADPFESTVTALYAMTRLNLYRWWSTDNLCAQWR